MESSSGREPQKERIMLRKSLAAMFVSLFVTGAAFAGLPTRVNPTPLKKRPN